MKLQKPKVPQLKVASGSRPYGPASGGAQNIGAVRSGHWHLALPSGGSRPGFGAAPKGKKVGRKMY